MKYHFSGYATRFNTRCSDGRTIKPGAFAHNDGMEVPLVWQHQHDQPINVIGHAMLECRDDGVYAYGIFNDTEFGNHAKALVHNKDVKALSIYANQLKEENLVVSHGHIKELSLVLSGANPGAYIDFVSMAHSDGSGETSAQIYTSDSDAELLFNEDGAELELKHSDEDQEVSLEEVFDSMTDLQKDVVATMLAHVTGDVIEHSDDEDGDADDDEDIEHSDGDAGLTVEEVFNTLTDIQKDVVYAMLAEAAKGVEVKQSDMDEDEDALQHDDQGGNEEMKKNVFAATTDAKTTGVLTHSDIKTIVTIAETKRIKLTEAVLIHMDAPGNEKIKEDFIAHAGSYGIENIGELFPDAKNIYNTPEFDKRQTEWVPKVLNATKKVPFSNIRSMYADLTADEARAKGYIKGNEKKEEVFPIFKRTTGPTTIYKKQKLDRNDIIDITDFDVVMWLKAEMRIMLNEEMARAILIGDGRAADDQDKIDELCIRPIYTDHEKYAVKVAVAHDATGLDELEAIKMARKDYKGTGRPTLFTTATKVIEWTLLKDGNQNYRFADAAAVAKFLNVKEIVEVEVMENTSRDIGGVDHALIGIIVNLLDYTTGANKGGNISLFDDFDIDFNQFKYLMETRFSGALTKIYSALVIEKAKTAG